MKQLLVAFVSLVAASAPAQNVVKPIRYTWVATSCPQWNCAAAALILAGGNPSVIVLPTGVDNRPWLILQRVEEGSVYVPDDEPFTCEVFSTVAEASARYLATEDCRAPQILSVPDRRTVVFSLQQCRPGKHRAVH